MGEKNPRQIKNISKGRPELVDTDDCGDSLRQF